MTIVSQASTGSISSPNLELRRRLHTDSRHPKLQMTVQGSTGPKYSIVIDERMALHVLHVTSELLNKV